jgi:hypothetical protein
MSITFSSCFYIIKSKNDHSIYVQWMNNLISIVNNFNLVIYTDENSSKHMVTGYNPKIKIIIKPIELFYNYKYKDLWIENHEKNTLLNNMSSWELNMLWSEKINFVKDTIDKRYFDTEFYGWCDIGYFRNRSNDMHTSSLSNWPDQNKIFSLDKNKICYACVNNNDNYLNELAMLINNKNDLGLPVIPIYPDQVSIAGGFFVIHKDKIGWWFQVYNAKLELYFKHNYLVKDDQMIIADCIFSNLEQFTLFKEKSWFDNWFMFQRIYL